MKKYRDYTDLLVERLQKSPEEAWGYLNICLADEDPDIFLIALKDVSDATIGGMAGLAKATGLSRESLYRTLSLNGNPRFSTLVAILDALGYKLAIEPKKPRRKKQVSKKKTRAKTVQVVPKKKASTRRSKKVKL